MPHDIHTARQIDFVPCQRYFTVCPLYYYSCVIRNCYKNISHVFVLLYYALTFNYANILNCDVIFLKYMPRSAAYSPEGKQTFVGNVQQSGRLKLKSGTSKYLKFIKFPSDLLSGKSCILPNCVAYTMNKQIVRSYVKF